MPDTIWIDEQEIITREAAKKQADIERFEQHLEYAKNVVASWPQWKRDILKRGL